MACKKWKKMTLGISTIATANLPPPSSPLVKDNPTDVVDFPGAGSYGLDRFVTFDPSIARLVLRRVALLQRFRMPCRGETLERSM
jgi:hypothetical protein